MKTSRALWVGLVLTVGGSLQAAREDGLPGAFLDVGVGARPLAMGRAFTGVADDLDSVYWNPAGLGTYRASQVEFQYAPLVDGGGYSYAAYSQPLYARGNLGLGIVNLSSGKIPRVDSNGIEFGNFSNRQTGYLIGYGQKVAPRWALGTTLKMAENVIDGQSARGVGLDVGSLWLLNERARWGLAVRNLLPPSYSYDTGRERFPTIVRTGASMDFLEGHVKTALDLEKTLGVPQGPKWHWGVEGFVIPNVILRAGYDPAEISGGVGVRWGSFQLDYAMGFQDAGLGLSNRVSLKAFFGGYEVDVKAHPAVFSPVGLKNKTAFKIAAANRTRVVSWIMTIRAANGDVVKTYQGYNAPPTRLDWDGRNAQGVLVPAGVYTYRMMVTDKKNRTETTPVRQVEILSPTPLEIEAK